MLRLGGHPSIYLQLLCVIIVVKKKVASVHVYFFTNLAAGIASNGMDLKPTFPPVQHIQNKKNLVDHFQFRL
jgi:hypothetical protein